jgi:thiol:disulfide interchange protein DsbD
MAELQSFGSIYIGVLAMGFFYGLTLCSFSCLPLVGPYVFGTRTGFRQGFDVTAVFIIARVAGYTVLGVLAGLVGKFVLERIGLQVPMLIAGLLVLAIGLLVVVKPRSACPGVGQKAQSDRRSVRHMATLGIATSLMPCPPLYAVMLYAATTQSALVGGLLAFLFGFGTLASPLYYLGGATGWLSGRIRQETQQKFNGLLRTFSGLLIVMFGLKLVFNGSGGF